MNTSNHLWKRRNDRVWWQPGVAILGGSQETLLFLQALAAAGEVNTSRKTTQVALEVNLVDEQR